MDINVNLNEATEYKFIKSLEEEIVQNIKNIITRTKGNLVLQREKGIEHLIDEVLDENNKALLVASINEEIEREEPRFVVSEINISQGENYEDYLVVIKGDIDD